MWSLQFDRNYGIDKRTGWTIHHRGICEVELEKSLVIALTKWGCRRIRNMVAAFTSHNTRKPTFKRSAMR